MMGMGIGTPKRFTSTTTSTSTVTGNTWDSTDSTDIWYTDEFYWYCLEFPTELESPLPSGRSGYTGGVVWPYDFYKKENSEKPFLFNMVHNNQKILFRKMPHQHTTWWKTRRAEK